MFDLSRLEQIFTYRETILNRGREYFRSGKIKEVKVNRVFQNTCLEVTALIEGTRRYKTSISFDEYNKFEGHYCTCPYHNDRWDVCKHVAALYIYLTESEVFRKAYLKVAGNDFLEDYFQNPLEKNRRKVETEYSINVVENWDGIFAHLSIKIGVDKLYVIKNLKLFLEDLSKFKRVEFGKKFEFNPSIHEFNERDREIFDYLSEIYALDKTFKASEGYYGHPASLFSGKNLKMDDTILLNLLNRLKGKSFNLILDNKTIENVTAEFSEMPFEVDVNNKDMSLLAELKYKGECRFFEKRDNLIYMDRKLYVIDKKSRAYSFLKSARKNKVNKLEFSGESKNIFLSILPAMASDEKIKVSEDIKKSYVNLGLEARIYLNRYKKGIQLKLEYKYGEEIFEPLFKSKLSPYIVRDYEKEERILSLIDESGFKVSEEGIYLDDSDKTYLFFRDVMPLLSKDAELYYTDDVKYMYLGRLRNYKSSVGFRSSTGIVDISIDIEGIDKKEIKDLLKSIKERKTYHRFRSGSFISLEDEKLKELRELVETIETDEIKNNVISLSKYRAVNVFQRLRDDTRSTIENSREVEKIVDNILNPDLEEIEVPGDLKGILRDYQVTGFKWMKTLSKVGFFGILADDMGLGKTLQAITLLYDDRNGEPSIVIAPASLIYNWEKEIKRFAPSLKTLVVAGSKEKREELISKAYSYDVIITSYPLIRRDIEQYEKINFNYCIIDEAQHIKNPESQNAASVKRIEADKRFALTGTPMENSLTELWSIFDFLMPGYLLSKHKFSERFERPITKDGDEYALSELKKVISPFILRRRKKDVLLELPDKIETKLVCELTEEQRKLYTAYLVKTREEIEGLIEEDGFERSRIQILSAITRLRQICCHPSVFIENYEGGSGKLELLEELLEELINGNHRILLFSQFTSLLAIIREELDKKNIKYMYLDGSTPVQERLNLVDRFNEGEGEIFLISLKAGGTGLNLTSADTVIHFDPWWNPAVEDQASDRAHRIGQKNVVQVFKIITKDTVEEKIFELQTKKKELINSVIKEGETFINKMSEEEIFDLLSI